MMFLDAKFAGVPCRENRYLEICLLRAQYSSLYLKFSIALSAVSAAITAYGVAPKHKMYVVWGLFLVGCVAAYVISTGEFDLFISAFLGGLFAAMALSAWSVYNNSHHSPH